MQMMRRPKRKMGTTDLMESDADVDPGLDLMPSGSAAAPDVSSVPFGLDCRRLNQCSGKWPLWGRRRVGSCRQMGMAHRGRRCGCQE